MSDDSLLLRRIDVRRAPGFEHDGPRAEELADGINIIYGANASGKTTLSRAIMAVLWPSRADERMEVRGRFELGDEQWEVQVRGSQAGYQRGGLDSDRPSLPSSDQRDRYRLSLHDLLQKDTRNRRFAEVVMRESAGGYDVPAAAEATGVRSNPTRANNSETNRARKAIEDYREAASGVQELRREEEELPRLETRLETIQKSARRVELLDLAIEYAQHKRELRRARARLAEFPSQMDRVRGDELERVDEIDSQIQKLKRQRDDATERIQEAEDRLEDANLPEMGVPDGLIGELKDLRNSLRTKESNLDDYEEKITGARRRCEEEMRSIGEAVSPEALQGIDYRRWGELWDFAREMEQVLAQQDGMKSLERLLKPDEMPDEDAEQLRETRRILQDWLAMPRSVHRDTPLGGHLPAAIVATLSVVALLLGLLTPVWIFAVGTALLGSASAAGLYMHRRRMAAEMSGERRTLEAECEQKGLPAPDEWDEKNVLRHLEEVNSRIGRLETVRERLGAWEARKAEFEGVEKRLEELAERREELASELGQPPEGAAPVQLAALGDRISRWKDARAELQQNRHRKEVCEEQYDVLLGAFADRISDYFPDMKVETAAQATGRIQELEKRREQFNEATRCIDQAETDRENCRESLDGLRRQREQLYTELGLEVGERDELRRLCELQDAYSRAEQERSNCRALMRSAEEELDNHRDCEPGLKERTLEELRDEREELADTAEEKEKIQQRKTRIETRIRAAREDNDIERAGREKQRALDALENRLQRDYRAMVGHELAGWLREETADAGRPEVFRAARAKLAEFTAGQYRLELKESGQPTFRVRDMTADQKGFALDQLSSATRVQVLMAVRLGFVLCQERGIRVPLMMDETLANTDDQRARAIIDAAVSLAQDGRQIFYFTAQADEVARWRQVLGATEGVNWSVTNIDGPDEVAGNPPDLTEAVPEIETPPSPQGCGEEEYADRLEVPCFDPRMGAASAHVWYVAGHPELVHRMVSAGVERWGQLKGLLETGNSSVISEDREKLAVIRRNGVALEAFTEAWQIGRGRPVNRTVLEESGAVSSKFIDEVSELAEELGGDGQALIDALRDGEVKGFLTKKKEELEDFLTARGCIDPADPLPGERIRQRMMARLLDMDLPREKAIEHTDDVLRRIRRKRP
ncbi:MAG: AAA family ATPase [Candidatus Brocadiia bacterium]